MIVDDVVRKLIDNRLSVATAESCTGGLIAGAITSVPGSSACFSYGLVTYSNEAKRKLLGVPQQILTRYGAVSSETAYAMADGLKKLTEAVIAVSVTGIAGPDGGSEEKPVGLVYIGLVSGGKIITERCQFSGSREEIRNKTVNKAIVLIDQCIGG